MAKPNNQTQKETAALKLVDIVKTYGDGENAVQALKGVNITFRKNEFVSVLGPSGCGKTTMLNIIGGLDRYTSGDLIINGVSTKEYKDRDWDTYRNNSIGFVFQSYNLIPHQTVLSNVELALTLSGVTKAERRERAKKVLEQVGLKGQSHKKPNQLSGGQMQRVAIARALVNDPEIILADEPTGALDTETSVQILDLLKEVARDRLVIMVTHNPDLAEKYSTRIINLLDGEKTGDTNPFTESAEQEKTEQEISDETVQPDKKKAKKEKKQKGKAAMKFATAFALSFSNLRTKKGRTTLTSIAGSIGIIGIALVLAVSTGFSGYINRLQSETLSTYPLTISEATIDLEDFQKLTQTTIPKETLEQQRFYDLVYTKAMFSDLTHMLKSNKLTDEYLAYVNEYIETKNVEASKTSNRWAYCIQRGYGMDINDYIFSDIGYNLNNGGTKHSIMSINTLVQTLLEMFEDGMEKTDMNISASFVREYIPTICEIPESSNLISSQYDLLKGELATKENELLLVVDKYNRVSDITLALLGFKSIEGMDKDKYSIAFDETNEFTFENVMNKEFYYVNNTERYTNTGTNFVSKVYAPDAASANPSLLPELPASAVKLKITGIVRLKDEVKQGVLQTGIAYTSAFVRSILSDEYNTNSEIVAAAKDDETKTVQVINPLMPTNPIKYTLRALAGDDTVTKVYIYSKGYAEKEAIKTYLDKWNEDPDRQEEDKVRYSDSTAMLFSAMNSIVDAVKIVLVAFTSISLVVSSIMIGIITYVSVVERTKEIGVLRSIGARKKDISRIFNAETFLIGLFAGLLGVAVSYLLTIPINLIIGSFIENAGAIAALRVVDAVILVVVSFALTLIAGVIPARIAANKDPVVALRSE
ncbi:MAG: ABC transporter ATP-binding protein/permease [Christensenellaceae bacterium]